MGGAKAVKLNNGATIPQLGYGVYQVDPKNAGDLVYQALKHGFRHIDTAEIYGNEKGAVEGIKRWLDEGNKRSDVFYTTKIKNDRITYDGTSSSIKERVEIAKPIEYIDLVLIHAPLTNKEGRLGSYKALQEYQSAHPDIVKSLGVSNYAVHHLKELFEWEGLKITPVVNQIELNPWLTHADIVEYGKLHNVHAEAYSPLTRGRKFDDPQLKELAKKYDKTPAQILLRWSLDKGFIALAKTNHIERLSENLDVLNFELEKQDVKALSHDDQYFLAQEGWDPTKYTG